MTDCLVLKRWLTKRFIIWTHFSVLNHRFKCWICVCILCCCCCCCCHASFLPPAKHTVCVCQMCFFTWEIPADRYRRIGVHMWKLGRVLSLLCYTEDTESVSWASPGTCSQTPALLVCTVSVYRNWRLLSSACKGAVTESFTKADIHLPTIHKLRRYCSVSAFSFEQHGSIQHQGDSWNPELSVGWGCQCSASARWWETFTAPVQNNTDSLETKLGSHLFGHIKPHPLCMREEPNLNLSQPCRNQKGKLIYSCAQDCNK